MKKNMFPKWAFWIIWALQFLVSSLELHYQIIKNSLYANLNYNNYNSAPSTALNYISYKTTDLLILMISVGWVLSSWLRTAPILHCSWFNHNSLPCSPLELSRRGSVPRCPCSRDIIQEPEMPLSPESLWENSIPLQVEAHYVTPLDKALAWEKMPGRQRRA